MFYVQLKEKPTSCNCCRFQSSGMCLITGRGTSFENCPIISILDDDFENRFRFSYDMHHMYGYDCPPPGELNTALEQIERKYGSYAEYSRSMEEVNNRNFEVNQSEYQTALIAAKKVAALRHAYIALGYQEIDADRYNCCDICRTRSEILNQDPYEDYFNTAFCLNPACLNLIPDSQENTENSSEDITDNDELPF